MSRINNLYDLHKTRVAAIYDGKAINVEYELKFKEREVQKKRVFDLTIRKGQLIIDCDKAKRLKVTISLQDKDEDFLWQCFISLVYLLGENITISLDVKDFPYYQVPKTYNFGGGASTSFARKDFLLRPVESIERCIALLQKDGSFFRSILVPMLHINNVELVDVRFFGEFVLLEYLSKKFPANGTIIVKKDSPQKYTELDSILSQMQDLIDSSDAFSDDEKSLLKRQLLIDRFNAKGTSKEKAIRFLQSLGKGFDRYLQYIDDWHYLRSRKGLAHASLLSSKVDLDEKDHRIMKELHNFFSTLLYMEFIDRLD